MSAGQQSTARKRPALTFGDPEPEAPQQPSQQAEPRPVRQPPPSRQGKKGVTFYLDPPGWKELRTLAMDLDTSTAELMVEATNLLFEKHKRPRIAKGSG